MANYELANDAEKDLQQIARYTISNCGSRQAIHYGTLIDAHFEALGNGKIRTRGFLQQRPELRVSRVKHHCVFHLERVGRCPLILAVFHKSMDLMRRLQDRLAI